MVYTAYVFSKENGTLTHSYLPVIGISHSRVIPVCKSKNQVYKNIPIQKEQIRYIYKNKKYTDGVLPTLHEFRWEYVGPLKVKRDSIVSPKKHSKGQ